MRTGSGRIVVMVALLIAAGRLAVAGNPPASIQSKIVELEARLKLLEAESQPPPPVVVKSDSGLPSFETALRILKDGNARFVADSGLHPHSNAIRRVETSRNGQHPFATIITCSDSRVSPEVLFDQGLGDLFVVRVPGNVSGVDEIGSAEYGVDHLETPLLVVLGHTGCGAVTAATTNEEIHGNLAALVDNIRPAVETVRQEHPNLQGKSLITAAARANVFQSISGLLRGSRAICERIKSGRIRILGAIYDIETGRVEWMGPHPRQESLAAATMAE